MDTEKAYRKLSKESSVQDIELGPNAEFTSIDNDEAACNAMAGCFIVFVVLIFLSWAICHFG